MWLLEQARRSMGNRFGNQSSFPEHWLSHQRKSKLTLLALTGASCEQAIYFLVSSSSAYDGLWNPTLYDFRVQIVSDSGGSLECQCPCHLRWLQIWSTGSFLEPLGFLSLNSISKRCFSSSSLTALFSHLLGASYSVTYVLFDKVCRSSRHFRDISLTLISTTLSAIEFKASKISSSMFMLPPFCRYQNRAPAPGCSKTSGHL